MILRGEPTGRWSMTDRVLAVAAVIDAERRCPGCGHLKKDAWNPDSEGWHELREAVCNACAVTEREREHDKKPTPGLKRWTVNVRPPEVQLAPWTPTPRSVASRGSATAR